MRNNEQVWDLDVKAATCCLFCLLTGETSLESSLTTCEIRPSNYKMPLVLKSTFGDLECSRDQQECNLQYTWLVITGTSRCVRLFCDARERLSVGCGMFFFNLSLSSNIPVFSHANDGDPGAFEENRGLVWKLAVPSSWPIDHADIKSFLQLVLTNMQLPTGWKAGAWTHIVQ